MREVPKVYLAGKVGGRKWEVVKPLSRADVEWIASDGSNHSEHLWGGGWPSWDLIGQPDLTRPVDDARKKIMIADCLIAYLDEADSYGSIVEVTLASAYQKRCLLIVLMPPERLGSTAYEDLEDAPSFDERAWRMADAYWFVSCLPGVRAAIVTSEAEATDVIRGFLLQTHRHVPKNSEEV
jgi:hypothetical protein